MRRVALLLASLLAACGPFVGGGDEALEVQLAGEQEEVAVYEALVAAFRKENPDIEVRLVPVADKDDHLAKLTTSFARGTPPDVFLVNFREYSQFVVRGAVEPAGPHLQGAGVDFDDYYEPPLEAFTFDGALQCMPQNISSLVVYYNEELFERAGLDRPQPDWSWSDFLRTAVALTEGDVRGVGIDPSIIRVAPFVWSNGGELVDDVDDPETFTLEEPRALEALRFVVSLAREHQVVPTEKEVAAQDLETRFVTGKLAMFLSSRRETPVFREVLGLDWDVASLPQARAPASILHSDAYCISDTSEHKDQAVRFISFAVGQRGQTITALGGRTVPSLRAVARSPAFLDPTRPPEHSEVFLRTIPYLRRTPVIATWPEIEDISEEILTRLFYEEDYSLEEGLEDLDEQTTPLFEEASE